MCTYFFLFRILFSARPPSEEECRTKLNQAFITSSAAVQYLTTLLENSLYSLRVPEEGALLAVLYLLKQGHKQ